MNVPVNTVCVIVSIIFYKNMVQIFYVRFKYLGKTTATEDLSLFFSVIPCQNNSSSLKPLHTKPINEYNLIIYICFVCKHISD